MEKSNNKKKYYFIGAIVLVLIIIILLLSSCSRGYKVELRIDSNTYYQYQLKKGDILKDVKEPVKDGYTFAGWYVNDEKFSLDTPIENDIVLEAHFTKNVYTVTFDTDNGDEETSVKVEFEDTVDMPTAPTREDYSFIGWFVGDKEYNFDDKITGDLDIVAKWIKVNSKYTVEHYLMGLDGKYGKKPYRTEILKGVIGKTVTPGVKKYTGFTSPNTKSVEILDDDELVLKYYYERNKYTLTINGDNGIADTIGDGSYYYGADVKVSVKVKDGYTFDKWSNKNKDLSFTYNIGSHDVVLTASTKVNTYEITYNLNGGTITDETEKYTVEDDDFDLGIPTREGYTFTGWLVNGEESDGTIKKGTFGNLEVEATFKANTDTKYKIQYYLMDVLGENYILDESRTENKEGTTDSAIEYTPASITGFKEPVLKDKNNQEVKIEDLIIEGDGSTVLKYYYEREKYTLTLEYDNGIKEVTGAGTYYYEAEVTVSAATKDGYTFDKWSNDEDKIEFTYKVDSKSETLKAITTINKYNINYNLNDGQLENPVKEYTVETDDFNLGTPTKIGYTFKEWKVNGKESDGIIKKGTFGDLEVEAIFVANKDTEYTVKHYLMDLNGESYTLKDIDNLKGETDSKVTPDVKNYDGFTAPDKVEVIINGDGTTTVEYKYSRNKYKVKIIKSTGVEDVNPSELEKYFEEKVTIDSKNVTFGTGYEFSHWLLEGEKVEGSTITFNIESHDMEVTVVPKKTPYTVTFKTDNPYRSVHTKEETYYYGDVLTEPSKVDWPHHDLLGWYLENGDEPLTDKWDFDKDTMPAHDITLVANWQIHDGTLNFIFGFKDYDEKIDAYFFNVSYNTKVDDLFKEKGTDSKSFTNPTHNGYKFIGWYKSSAFKSTDKIENILEYTMPDSKGVTLYAKWEPITYMVEFVPNNDLEVEHVTQTFTYDDPNFLYHESEEEEPIKKPLEKNTYTRTGYTFSGWSKNESGTSVDFVDSQEVANLTDKEETIKLYAVWFANDYIVTYDSNKGNGSTEPTGKVSETTHTYDENSKLSETTYSREGYTFLGWSKEQHKDSVDNCDDCIKSANNLATGTSEDSNVTLYAVWKANTYIITYDSNRGNGSTEPTGEVGSTTHRFDNTTDLNKKGYSRDGYSFLGWSRTQHKDSVDSCEEDCITSANNLATGAVDDNNVTLYAVWKANTYTITYDSNKGSGSIEPQGEVKTTTHRFDEVSDLTKDKFTRTGYKFVGWSKSEKSTIADVTKADNLTTDTNVTLYAIWEKETYTIKFIDKTLNETSTATYTVEDDVILDIRGIEEGYSFDGWYESDKLTGNVVISIPKGTTGDKTYYAKRTGVEYIVVYSKDGTDSVKEETFVYGKPHTAADATTISIPYSVKFDSNGGNKVDDKIVNATVKNWKINGSEKGEMYSAGQSIVDLIIPTTTGQKITLIPADYTYPSIDIPATSKNGDSIHYLLYELSCWSDDTTTYTSGSKLVVDKDFSLTAQWKNVVDTDTYINDNIRDKTIVSSTLTGLNIDADIIQVNKKVLEVITENSYYVTYMNNLLDNPSVTSITLKYDTNSYTVTRGNVYDNIKKLFIAMTNTSSEKEETNRLLSSLYSSDIPKKFTIQVNVSDGASIKGKNGTNVIYTTTFKSSKVVSITDYGNYKKLLDKDVNSKKANFYEIVQAEDDPSKLRMLYAQPNKYVVFGDFDNMGDYIVDQIFGGAKSTGGLGHSGLKTMFENLIDNKNIESLTFYFKGMEPVVLHKKDIGSINFAENLMGPFKEASGYTGEDVYKMKNSDLANLSVDIQVNAVSGKNFEDGIITRFTLTFGPRNG